MPRRCPLCDARANVIRTRVIADGSKRWRIVCSSQSCGHRWTAAQGQPLRSDAAGCQKKPQLTEDQVRLILTSGLSLRRLVPLVDRSPPVISAVLTGKSYAELCPDLPRREAWQTQRSCLKCRYWDHGHCREGWPDPIAEGTGFAQYCDDYERR